jgi:hypothetical protein
LYQFPLVGIVQFNNLSSLLRQTQILAFIVIWQRCQLLFPQLNVKWNLVIGQKFGCMGHGIRVPWRVVLVALKSEVEGVYRVKVGLLRSKDILVPRVPT